MSVSYNIKVKIIYGKVYISVDWNKIAIVGRERRTLGLFWEGR